MQRDACWVVWVSILTVTVWTAAGGATVVRAAGAPSQADLEKANPVRPLPGKPLGQDVAVAELPGKPDPVKARLGRWLFFDKRLSADGTIACATCHEPRCAFSQQTPVSTGIRGQKGARKAPSFVNAVYAMAPLQFWDGRAADLEAQASGPMANPIEMGNTHAVIVKTVARLKGYAPFFKQAFGDAKVTLDRITKAIADYERTRTSGNSPWDRWKHGTGADAEKAVSAQVKEGDALFFGKANCARCHVGNTFSDGAFHNLGIGYDPAKKAFSDPGRGKVTGKAEDLGAFKTPSLRDTALHPPYMHDGSIPTLAAVVEHYRKGGTPNPHLDSKMEKIDLTDAEAASLVAFMEALTGEGYLDEPPSIFPQ